METEVMYQYIYNITEIHAVNYKLDMDVKQERIDTSIYMRNIFD